MEITDEIIDHLSNLAKLSFEGDKKEEIKQNLSNMLNYMDEISKIDTENVEPLIFITDEINVLREDVPSQTITHEEVLKNAPKKDTDYFRIPKMINKTTEE